MPRRTALAAGLIVLLWFPHLWAATDPGATCTEKKARVTGKKAAELLKAFGRNLKQPNATRLGVDVSKARSKFTRSFTKAETAGSCRTSL